MTDEIDAQGYRANVGIVLMQPDGRVFLGRRAGGKGWQFPQGGIQSGETLEQAMYRELREEIGLEPEHVEIVGMTQRWLRYRLPDRYIRREQLPLCLGQKQRWFLLRGIGPGLAPFGVSTALADPQLTVFRGEAVVAHNDDWSSSHWTSELAAAAASVQAFALPESSADAALVVQLPPGNYTFQVAAKGSTSGTVLGEAYELP